MKQIINKNFVTMANKLIKASYTMGLSEKRVLMLIISNINNDPQELEQLSPSTIYSFTIDNYAETYNIRVKDARKEVKDAMRKLLTRQVTLISEGYKDTEKAIEVQWFTYLNIYMEEENTIGFKWSEDIIPYISDLRKNFTSYRIRFLSNLSSAYSIRLYEYCVMELNRARKNRMIIWLDVYEYKKALDLPFTYYPSVSDLVKRVIKDPANTINMDEKCDINILLLDDKGKMRYKRENGAIKQLGFIAQFR